MTSWQMTMSAWMGGASSMPAVHPTRYISLPPSPPHPYPPQALQPGHTSSHDRNQLLKKNAHMDGGVCIHLATACAVSLMGSASYCIAAMLRSWLS